MKGKIVLYNWANYILTLLRGRRIFIFTESVKDLEKMSKEIEGITSANVNVFTDTKEILEDVNAHPTFKYSEGYIIEKQDKKSTTKILATFIHQSAPRIKLKTLQLHQ
jgi:hypothetical protein